MDSRNPHYLELVCNLKRSLEQACKPNSCPPQSVCGRLQCSDGTKPTRLELAPVVIRLCPVCCQRLDLGNTCPGFDLSSSGNGGFNGSAANRLGSAPPCPPQPRKNCRCPCCVGAGAGAGGPGGFGPEGSSSLGQRGSGSANGSANGRGKNGKNGKGKKGGKGDDGDSGNGKKGKGKKGKDDDDDKKGKGKKGKGDDDKKGKDKKGKGGDDDKNKKGKGKNKGKGKDGDEDKSKSKRPGYSHMFGDRHPCGHVNCVNYLGNIPKHMGWLWTEPPLPGVDNVKRGWRPGAVSLPVKRIMKTHLNLCKCNERVKRILDRTKSEDTNLQNQSKQSNKENKENGNGNGNSKVDNTKKNGKSKNKSDGIKVKLEKNTASGVELSAQINCADVKLPPSCVCYCDRPFFKCTK